MRARMQRDQRLRLAGLSVRGRRLVPRSERHLRGYRKLELPYPFANEPNTRDHCPQLADSGAFITMFTINKAFLGFTRNDPSDGKLHLTMLDPVSGYCADSTMCNLPFDSSGPLPDSLL